MKKFLFLIIFFVLTSSLFSQQNDSLFNLSVTSVPENYDVYIDTVFIGKTPVINHKLKASAYTLRIMNLNTLKEWESESKIIFLNLKSDTSFSVSFRNEYFINTIPSNASVIKNDSVYGFTPLRFFSKEKLTGNILLQKPGYMDKILSLDKYDFGAGITEILTPVSTTKNDVWKNRSTNFNTKRNFPLIAVLGAAVAGGTFGTFHFKSKANDAYDRYLTTYNPSDYDESKTNDTYSAIFLIASEVTLAVLVYFLFGD